MAAAGSFARPSFKSLISRIVFLHIIAIAVVAIFLPLVLFWLLNSEIDQLHRAAMRAQAETLAERIAVQPDGRVTFNLPESLRGLYSEAYGRYQYDIRDADGRLLFSSHKKTGDVESGVDFRRRRDPDDRRHHRSHPGGGRSVASRRHHRRHRVQLLPPGRVDHHPHSS